VLVPLLDWLRGGGGPYARVVVSFMSAECRRCALPRSITQSAAAIGGSASERTRQALVQRGDKSFVEHRNLHRLMVHDFLHRL
jgi:hypothetical protein